MPTLRARTVGMSYAVEALEGQGLDPADLLEAMSARFGLAVAPMGQPVETILVDRRACGWDELLDWLEQHIRAAGYSYTSWVAMPATNGSAATLHYHRAGE